MSIIDSLCKPRLAKSNRSSLVGRRIHRIQFGRPRLASRSFVWDTVWDTIRSEESADRHTQRHPESDFHPGRTVCPHTVYCTMQEQLLNTFDKCAKLSEQPRDRRTRFLRMYQALGRNCLANNYVAKLYTAKSTMWTVTAVASPCHRLNGDMN